MKVEIKNYENGYIYKLNEKSYISFDFNYIIKEIRNLLEKEDKIMKEKLEVTLSEADVHIAIKEYIKKHNKLDVINMRFVTSVRGDYDRGNAVEYVEAIHCDCIIEKLK